MEVPSIETNATGLAEFKPKLNENAVAYSLNITDIDNVTQPTLIVVNRAKMDLLW